MTTNTETTINIHELENIKTIIDKMDKNQHIEILKIINKDPAVKINENKSGIYINLSFLPENTMKKIKTYISYIQDQEKVLTQMENIKAEYTNTFFTENDIMMNEISSSNDIPIFTK